MFDVIYVFYLHSFNVDAEFQSYSIKIKEIELLTDLCFFSSFILFLSHNKKKCQITFSYSGSKKVFDFTNYI